MPFVIKSNCNSYIRQNISEFELVPDSDGATKWKSGNAANRILSQLKRRTEFIIKDLRVERYVYKSDYCCPQERDPTMDTQADPHPEIIKENYNNLDFNVVDKALDFVSYAKLLETKREKLIEQQRQIEREIVDIEHAIEFRKLNACEGYKMYRLLHDTRVLRRSVKDQLTVIDSLIPAVNIDQVDRISRKIESLSNRKYDPRTDLDLFDEEQT